MVKTTTAINFKDLPKEIKECLGSVHNKALTKIKMSDFTEFPDIESFNADKLQVSELHTISDLSLSQSISGTREDCHKRLDSLLDDLDTNIPKKHINVSDKIYSFEVISSGYDSSYEYSNINWKRAETQEEYDERQEKIAKSKKLQEFLPEFKKMLDRENKKNNQELEDAYQKELEAVKKKFGKL